jgi:methylated-DNA-[protein]-cysteine S-methyltransferase
MADFDRALRDSVAALPADVPAEGLERFAERALGEGLVDVGYGPVDSPLGTLTVAATPRGLLRVAYPSNDPDLVLEDLAARVSPRLIEAPKFIDEVRRELDEYFDGRRERFDIPLDWTLTRGFNRKVLQATARVGYGALTTYAEVAARAGSPRAVRAAGNALGRNPIPIVVPCHRVLRTGGKLGGYTGGIEKKEFLLSLEGVRQDV